MSLRPVSDFKRSILFAGIFAHVHSAAIWSAASVLHGGAGYGRRVKHSGHCHAIRATFWHRGHASHQGRSWGGRRKFDATVDESTCHVEKSRSADEIAAHSDCGAGTTEPYSLGGADLSFHGGLDCLSVSFGASSVWVARSFDWLINCSIMGSIDWLIDW